MRHYYDYFIPEDAEIDYQQIASNEPLFESFGIYGPKDFNSDEIICLYDYPHLHYQGQNDFTYCSTYSLPSTFFFPNGPERTYINFDQNSSIINHPEKIERLIYIKNDIVSTYVFCVRIRCTPFQRPAAISRECFYQDEYCQKYLSRNNQSNSEIQELCLSESEFELFIAYLKKELLTTYMVTDRKHCPSSFFSYCFFTRHPYPDLFFSLIEKIIQLELKSLASAKNISEFLVPTPIGKKVKHHNSLHNSSYNWPENAYFSREKFLKMLFEDAVLPFMGETIKFDIDRSIHYSFEWKRPEYENTFINLTEHGLFPLFKRFSLESFLDILKCLFIASPIYVIHNKLPTLTRVVSGLQSIIYPFLFENYSFSHLPEFLYDGFLTSPIGSPICGCLKSERVLESLTKRNDILLIDIEAKEIVLPKEVIEHQIVMAKYAQYHQKLQEFCIQETKKFKRNNKFDLTKTQEIIQTIMKLNKTVFINPMESAIVTKINSDDGGESGSKFNKEAYLSHFQKNEQLFIIKFLENQSVKDCINVLCQKKSKYSIPDSFMTTTPSFPEFQLKQMNIFYPE